MSIHPDGEPDGHPGNDAGHSTWVLKDSWSWVGGGGLVLGPLLFVSFLVSVESFTVPTHRSPRLMKDTITFQF